MRPPRAGQQVLHDLGQPLDLDQRDPGLLLGDRHGVGGGDLLQPHRQRGQRRPQLVRGVGGEVPLGRQRRGHPAGAALEHLLDLVDLGDPAVDRDQPRLAGRRAARRCRPAGPSAGTAAGPGPARAPPPRRRRRPRCRRRPRRPAACPAARRPGPPRPGRGRRTWSPTPRRTPGRSGSCRPCQSPLGVCTVAPSAWPRSGPPRASVSVAGSTYSCSAIWWSTAQRQGPGPLLDVVPALVGQQQVTGDRRGVRRAGRPPAGQPSAWRGPAGVARECGLSRRARTGSRPRGRS